MLNKLFYAVILICGFTVTDIAHATDADVLWSRMVSMDLNSSGSVKESEAAASKYGKGTAAYIAWEEGTKLEFRRLGQEFWKAYPQDPRRFIWLRGTLNPMNAPNYWTDPMQAGDMMVSKGERPENIP